MKKAIDYIKKNRSFILMIAVAFFVFLWLEECGSRKTAENEKESIQTFLNDSIDYYKNKNGQLVAEKSALKGSNNKLSKNNDVLQVLLSKQVDSTQQLKKLVSEFKTIDAAGNITTETKLEDIQIDFDEPIEFDFIREWSKNDKFYSIYGKASQVGIKIDSLYIPTLISFGIGEKRKNFFSTEYKFEATSSNPHVSITGLDGGTFTERRKRLGISAYVGYGLGSNFSFQPSAGLALTYTIFWF
ncbi:hypothetical protein [Mesonia aquimarina]|uniref:hypothetical protein n=1 Tax=Mesonia aquimarina TaxID=1504967 RepID=UPI000EF5D43A|nr:hypothetical protein [Mesonia aquimarina]